MSLADVTEWKNSGIFWSPMIPNSWSVLRFKELFSYTTGITPDSKNDSYFELESGNSWITIGDMNARIVYEGKLGLSAKALSEFQPSKTPKGSLLFSFKLSIGKVCFAGKDFYTNEAIASIRSSSKYDLRFWFYYLPRVLHENAIENIYGAKMLNQSIIVNMLMAVPSVDMQSKIADHLDSRCAAIDRKVALLEQKRTAYAKLKRALINETVTRGLDKNAELADSGVDWIGRVPAGWSVRRVKDIGYLYGGLNGKSGDDFHEEDIDKVKPFIPFTNVFKNFMVDVSDVRYVAMKAGEIQNRVRQGDVLFLMSSEDYDGIGKPAVISDEVPELYLNSFCRGLRITKRNICPEFVNYYLNSHKCREQIRLEGRGFTRINIKVDRISGQDLKLPAIIEQRRIADYLDRKCAAIDAAVENVTRQIELYRKLKRSLIDEVVTGRRKVA